MIQIDDIVNQKIVRVPSNFVKGHIHKLKESTSKEKNHKCMNNFDLLINIAKSEDTTHNIFYC
jgi:hypothetical protein